MGTGNEAFHGADREDFLHKIFADITKWSVRVERAEDIDGAGEAGHAQPAGPMQGMHAEPVRARVDKDAPGLAQSMPVGIRLDACAQQGCGADQ